MGVRVVLPTLDDSDAPQLEVLDGWSNVVQRQLRRGGVRSYERPTVCALLTIFSMQRPGFVFYDVGANIGYYSTLCGRLFEPAAVVAFEPTPETADWARRIADANGVAATTRVEQVAVGREAGEGLLHLSDVSEASNSLVAGFKPSGSSIPVEVVTIDDHVAVSGLVPDVVKIDAEGFEPEVLAGAQRTLAEHRPILVVEVLYRFGHDYGPSIEAELRGIGYHRYRLVRHPRWREWPRLRGGRSRANPEPGREEEGSEHRDWMLIADSLSEEFVQRHERWSEALRTCSARRNVGDPGRSSSR